MPLVSVESVQLRYGEGTPAEVMAAIGTSAPKGEVVLALESGTVSLVTRDATGTLRTLGGGGGGGSQSCGQSASCGASSLPRCSLCSLHVLLGEEGGGGGGC